MIQFYIITQDELNQLQKKKKDRKKEKIKSNKKV